MEGTYNEGAGGRVFFSLRLRRASKELATDSPPPPLDVPTPQKTVFFTI